MIEFRGAACEIANFRAGLDVSYCAHLNFVNPNKILLAVFRDV